LFVTLTFNAVAALSVMVTAKLKPEGEPMPLSLLDGFVADSGCPDRSLEALV